MRWWGRYAGHGGPALIVVTCLLTAQPDPQRHTTLPADPALLDTLRSSVTSKGFELHVLADSPLDIDDPLVTVHPVPPGGNPYFHRWAVIADFIADRDDEWVWCVDGTDTELLERPAPGMDVLHIGSEPLPLGCSWMRATNPRFAAWIDEHADRPLLNPGITGGPASTVSWFARAVAAEEGDDMTDMGAANFHAYHLPHVTGAPVHTEYRAHETAGAWWRHK